MSVDADSIEQPPEDTEIRDTVIAIIDAHIPSLTDEDEDYIDNSARLYVSDPGIERDAADLAVRTCHCGVAIDGYYEFVDHLKDVLRKEMS